MEFSGIGGGIMVALAAGLWLVYLMPTWFKRREYAATERNEVRRQHALRVLQETSTDAVAKPAEPVASIVSPTGVVRDHDRLAEAIQRSRDAQAARMAGRQLSEAATPPARAASARAHVARRLRRTRAVASLLLLAAIATVLVQATLMVTTGAVLASWGVLGFGAVVGVVSVAALGRLATIARRKAVTPVRAAQPMRTRVIADREAARPPIASWTPVPVPKPIYLSRAEASAASLAVDPVEQLRAAALESDRALREAQESPEVMPITTPAPPALPAPNRYAAMGIVGREDVEGTNLDEVLRRRRA